MPTQAQIAIHLGISQQSVSRQLIKMKIDASQASMDQIRLAYIAKLRSQTDYYDASGGQSIAGERALTERVNRDLKIIKVHELRSSLVNMAQLRTHIALMLAHFHHELRHFDGLLQQAIEARYQVTLDPDVIAAYTKDALQHIQDFLAEPSRGASGSAVPHGSAQLSETHTHQLNQDELTPSRQALTLPYTKEF